MLVFVKQYNLGMWFIVHTLCHYCEMVATAAGNKVSKYLEVAWKSCQVEDEGEIQHLGTNKYIPLVSCISNLFKSWYCLLKSRYIVHRYLLSTYSCGIRILSAMLLPHFPCKELPQLVTPFFVVILNPALYSHCYIYISVS